MSSNKNKNYHIIAWLICTLGAIYYAYEYFLRIAPSVMEPQLRNHFNLSASGFGFLSAFYYYAYVPMQLPVGVLMDRYGPRRLLTLACLLCVFGTFLFAGTTVFSVAASGRFLVGLGSSFAFVGVLKLATIWLPEDKLAMVAGMAAALGTIGAMIGDNILGAMVFNFGWQPTVYITGFFGLGLTIVLWFGIKDNKRKTQKRETLDSFKKNMIDLGNIAKNGQIWINGFYGCLVYLPTTVFAELWGIPYLRHAYGMSETEAHFANSLLFLGFTIGAPLMGYISDRLHRRKPPMMIGASGAALIMMLIIYMPNINYYTLYFLMLLLGILYSAQAIVFAVGRELSAKEAAGTAIAMTNMIVMIGAMFLQPLVGALLDWSSHQHMISVPTEGLLLDKMNQFYTADDYRFAMSIIPLGILIAAILTLFLRETYASSDANTRQ
ncbi:MFS transporter [Legionella yabuuchiae]|uniref:MFS transporter n=1 Tax=Legionella yabuuchiae TaxID=376727 RepID=UPI0013EFC029|nr:MFS transporter [Legionella yabuuchiae]